MVSVDLENELLLSGGVILREKSVHSAEYQLLIQQLREARLRAKLSQRRVSALLGMPYTFMQKVESLERQINPVELMKCCQVLEVDFVQFLTEFSDKVQKDKVQKL